jgi:antitoxin (DNA-binding transcriptional repressor) of toxin-antitoxin stability system
MNSRPVLLNLDLENAPFSASNVVMSIATVAQFAKDPVSFIEAAEHGQTVHLLRNGKRVARLSPEPARPARGKLTTDDLTSWIAREQPFLNSMRGKSRGKSAVRSLQKSRR